MSHQIEKTYTVEGMTCHHCELSVQEEVEELAGVDDARANHATGELQVRGTNIDDASVRDAVAAAGYQLASPPSR